MGNELFTRYISAIRTTNFSTISNATAIPVDFQLARESDLSTYYIPFDFLNHQAKVVLVGITPGFTQWKNAMAEAQAQLNAGAAPDAARLAAKRTGAFSGSMRPNLIALLDAIGLQSWLKIDSCSVLFGARPDLVQTTSILRHPVFVAGENYNGAPDMVRTPFLRQQMLDHFAQEAAQLANAVYIPLGPKVSAGLLWLAKQGVLNGSRILDGLPHPSGANAERIAYFLGRKDRAALSSKTNAAQLNAARQTLKEQVSALG